MTTLHSLLSPDTLDGLVTGLQKRIVDRFLKSKIFIKQFELFSGNSGISAIHVKGKGLTIVKIHVARKLLSKGKI